MARPRFGPSVKKARVRLGMTQTELGKKLEPSVGPATISLWENENSIPSDEQKSQIKRWLGQSSIEPEAKNHKETVDKEDVVEAPSAIGAWLNKSRLARGFSVPELAAKSGLSSVSLYNIESGRSQNPQRATIEKLEKALNLKLSTEAKEEAKEEATIDGVGEWFNFNPNSQSEWPKAAGIYVLYDISDRPIYVGQGRNIFARLRDHYEKFWFKPPIVQNAAYVGIDNRQLREQIERVLIKFLKSNAVLNQQNVDR
jgi:ribosome-binding protein aMBF1 (putative translation factor)